MISRTTAALLSFAISSILVCPVAQAATANAQPPTRPSAVDGNGEPVELPKLPDPVSVIEFSRKLGLKTEWMDAGNVLRLKSKWSTIDFNADSREMTLNGVRTFLGEAALAGENDLLISPIDRDRFLFPILAPHLNEPRAPIKHIVLDPGHGGSATGTRNVELEVFEKDQVLKVAQKLGPMLETRGFKVSYTRTEDVDLDLEARSAYANEVGADLFLSIHFNSARADVHGIETYLLTRQHQRSTGSGDRDPTDSMRFRGHDFDGWNAYLGFTMHKQLLKDLEAFDRGLKQARFVVLKDIECPGLLLELGYISNPEEVKRIQDSEYQTKIAASIANGVDVFNQSLKRLEAVRNGNGG